MFLSSHEKGRKKGGKRKRRKEKKGMEKGFNGNIT